MSSLTARFKAARRVGTPLVAISTADQQAAVAMLREVTGAKVPVILWDIVRGWQPGNEPGKTAIMAACDGSDPAAVTMDPVECLALAAKLPDTALLFCMNAHRLVSADDRSRGGQQTIQAVANLRDQFKLNLRTLVLLGPSFSVAPELAPDILMLEDPLPNDEALRNIVTGLLPGTPDDALLTRAVDAVRGLAAFSAEQATALALAGKNGGSDAGTLDLDELWGRKRSMIAATPGLSVWGGEERLDHIGGCVEVKTFARRLLAGREAPRCVVFVDEIEKAMAGATGAGGGDSSGVSQAFLGTFLTEMQDNGWGGTICVGPPGAAKSAFAKAVGAEAGLPTIVLDLGGMKGSLVGQSEERLRTAMRTIKAVGGSRVYVVATCNKITTLPPELRRRFTLGTFFFDLPDASERAAIWAIYRKQFGKDGNAAWKVLPNDEGWTGAEIRQCAILSHRLNLTLIEAAAYIVPVSRSNADDLEALRRQADGRFLSASYPGTYRRAEAVVAPVATKRKLTTNAEV